MLKSFLEKGKIEAGCDEAGRGCLAGPVFAAAVILPKDFNHPLLNDSKQMKEADRNLLRPIIEKQALSWAVAWCDEREIDKINILNASFLAMHRGLDQLKILPEIILVDGNRFRPYKKIIHHCIVGGDAKYKTIAAASILAKTHRDEYMQKLHAEFPQFGWDKNKAYATAFHRIAVLKYGQSPYHRKSFKLHNQLKFPFYQ
ncbi:MAG: ribonuclease HII [Bacteroidia bacterium]